MKRRDVDTIQLKDRLARIASDSYRVDGSIDLFDLCLEMMENIGTTDPELRDALIYETFCVWISKNLLSAEQLKVLFHTALDDEHLFHKIGFYGDDSVFTRSFSILLIIQILQAHRRTPLFALSDLDQVKSRIIDYMAKEKDVRGYVQCKGWAHSAAHGADALNALVLNNFLDEEGLMDILECIYRKVCINHYAYINNEDERLVTPTIAVVNNGVLELRQISKWLSRFAKVEKVGRYPEDLYLNTNIKNYLRSLYFRLLKEDDLKMLVHQVRSLLNDMYK